MGAAHPRGPAARAAGPGRPVGRRLHPRRPGVGAGEGGPGGRDSERPHRRSSSSSRARRSTAGTPAFELAAAEAMRDIPTAPHVAGVVSHLLQPRQVSADGHTAYDIVFLDLPPDDSPEAVPILRERLRDAPGLQVELAGGPAFYGDVQEVSERDLQRSELISLPLAALALLLVFGSLVAAGRPARRRWCLGPRRPGRHLRRRVGDADEHLRPQPRDAPRTRTRASTTRC